MFTPRLPMKVTKATLCGGIAALSLIAAGGNATAATITLIEDSFSRLGTLTGSSADTGQTWSSSGSSSWGVTGAEVDVSAETNARIDGLTLLPNSEYVLTVDINMTSAGDDALGFGFSAGPLTPQISSTPLQLLHTGINPTFFQLSVRWRLGQNASGGITDSPMASNEPFPRTMELRLITGATLANSEFSFGGPGFTSPVRSMDASTIDGIFLRSWGTGRGSFDNLRLTRTAVPEPSSALLLGLAIVPALRRRRR